MSCVCVLHQQTSTNAPVTVISVTADCAETPRAASTAHVQPDTVSANGRKRATVCRIHTHTHTHTHTHIHIHIHIHTHTYIYIYFILVELLVNRRTTIDRESSNNHRRQWNCLIQKNRFPHLDGTVKYCNRPLGLIKRRLGVQTEFGYAGGWVKMCVCI